MTPQIVYMAKKKFLKPKKLLLLLIMMIIMIIVSSLTVYLNCWKWIVGTGGGTPSNRHVLKPLDFPPEHCCFTH